MKNQFEFESRLTIEETLTFFCSQDGDYTRMIHFAGTRFILHKFKPIGISEQFLFWSAAPKDDNWTCSKSFQSEKALLEGMIYEATKNFIFQMFNYVSPVIIKDLDFNMKFIDNLGKIFNNFDNSGDQTMMEEQIEYFDTLLDEHCPQYTFKFIFMDAAVEYRTRHMALSIDKIVNAE